MQFTIHTKFRSQKGLSEHIVIETEIPVWIFQILFHQQEQWSEISQAGREYGCGTEDGKVNEILNHLFFFFFFLVGYVEERPW